MQDAITSACRFCGQMVTVPTSMAQTAEDAEDYAAMHCNCPGAAEYQAKQKAEKERKAALARARERIDSLCGDVAVGYGLIPITEENRELMYDAATLIYDDKLKSFSVNINGCVTVKISKSAKGKLVFFRSDVSAYKQEM